MKNTILTISILTIAGILTAAVPVNAETLTYDEAIKEAYKTLVTEKQNTVTFTCDDDRVLSMKFIDDLTAIDDEDSLYDGILIDARGKEHIHKQGNKYTIEIENAYDIDEADALTDEMVEEVKRNLPENATDREKYYEIARYIKKTFKYDLKAYVDYDNNATNFVEAYHGSRRILCNDFATVTYLIANKLGLDCKILLGKGHMYNGIKFDDDTEYTAIDFAEGWYLGGYVPGIVEIDPGYRGSDKKYASIGDMLDAVGYTITH